MYFIPYTRMYSWKVACGLLSLLVMRFYKAKRWAYFCENNSYKGELKLFNATIQASFSVVNGDKVSKQKVRREWMSIRFPVCARLVCKLGVKWRWQPPPISCHCWACCPPCPSTRAVGSYEISHFFHISKYILSHFKFCHTLKRLSLRTNMF